MIDKSAIAEELKYVSSRLVECIPTVHVNLLFDYVEDVEMGIEIRPRNRHFNSSPSFTVPPAEWTITILTPRELIRWHANNSKFTILF